MKLLLCKTVDPLGIVGDVVDVSPGYARNFLLPKHLATEPTEANRRKLVEARRLAEEERTRQRAELETLAAKLLDVEVTVRARANEEGVLYGSVGAKEIVEALADDGYYIKAEQVVLPHPLRQLDNVSVDLRLTDGVTSSIKVWVVREKSEDEESPEDSEHAAISTEADFDDDSARD